METQTARTASSVNHGNIIPLEEIVSILASTAEGIRLALAYLGDRISARQRSRPDRSLDGWAVRSEREEYLRRSEMLQNKTRQASAFIGIG